MKKLLRRLAALGLSAGVLWTSALALTPEELGKILQERYVGEVPRQVGEETTVEGMMKALGDPYSRYLTPQEYDRYLSAMSESGQTGPTVRGELREGHVGWLELRSFGPETYGTLKAEVERLNPQTDRWVADLRQNRGGELKAAADAMSVFVSAGNLVYLRDRAGKLYAARAEEKDLTLDPVIALVGADTASAGELYAANIRDRQAGIVIGSRTYGKGVAQTAFTKDHETYGGAFADGSALLLSTELVFSEAMNTNNIMGVIPDLVVDDSQAEAVARLLCASAPGGDASGHLRVHVGGWRWYVDLAQAAAEPAAFRALLEALPPDTDLYLGTGKGDWNKVTAADVAQGQSVAGYTPRTFPDLGDSPYQTAIDTLKTYGILQGDEQGNFKPDSALDRATLCALLAQAMDYPKSTGSPAFADTPADAWYTPYVTTLSAMGIVNGYDDGLFHPEDPIPHQQFMAILARIAANTNQRCYSAKQAGPTQEDLASGDYDAYDPWFRTEVWLLDGRWHAAARDIDPKGVTLREEAAYDLWSALATLGVLPR